MKKLTIVMLAALMLAVSCKKDEDNNNNGPQLTKKEMLTAKSWKATGLTIGGQDAWSSVDACSRDDIHTFKTDGTYTLNEGATKCDPADPQEISDTWVFTDNETKITYDGETATIKELTSTKLVLESDFLGSPAVVTFSNQ